MSKRSFFTQKHFEFIADVLHDFGCLSGADEMHPYIVELFADKLQETNPKFKRDMFKDRALYGINNTSSSDQG